VFQLEPAASDSTDDLLGPDMDKADLHDQYTEQQKLILQLKAMIRERGESLEEKEKEIKASFCFICYLEQVSLLVCLVCLSTHTS